MEGFVLGGAILLHDAALCFEAYEGGQEGLRQCVEWKDAYAAAQDRSPHESESNLRSTADFAALRNLHAKQAGRLGTKGWKTDGKEIHLIDDFELRKYYGETIGLIAESHNWPLEKVSSKLRNQINTPGGFPREWRVDPVKIACLLRCADAAHIDDRRAPDFLRALARRQGISANHWTAQNWLTRVDLDQSDPEKRSLLFTSNQNFGIEDVDAWWVAYDAIQLVESEIMSSNLLLASRGRSEDSPAFKIQKVSGTASPEALSEHICVQGWKPCAAKIHVGNIAHLVETLGGATLYGTDDQLTVVLRELIQNARDAVVARRNLSSAQGYEGIIRIRLKVEIDGTKIIDISDNGSGMSERVLTGPFLDFGNSFWVSDLAQHEFPGLRSSRFQPVGRYGIGFYSIFMAASEVNVFTRRWDSALTDTLMLSFPKGLTLRPTLSKQRPDDFEDSTIVSFHLKSSFADWSDIKVRQGIYGMQDHHVSFADYIASIVAGLDVDVEFKMNNDGDWKRIHSRVTSLVDQQSKLEWLETISFRKYAGPINYIQEYCTRLRYIYNGDRVCGLAALSTDLNMTNGFLARRTIGGLVTSAHGMGIQGFAGFLDYRANSAKRDVSQFIDAPRESIEEWANEQIELLKANDVDLFKWCGATLSLCELELDPINVMHAIFCIEKSIVVKSLSDIFDMIKTEGIAIYMNSALQIAETYVSLPPYASYPTFRAVRNSVFLNLEIDSCIPKHKNSFIGCLHRYAEAHKSALKYQIIKGVAASWFGAVDVMIVTT
ncbi:MAG TPA: ATP-binding protein [Methylobacter sp.]